MRKIVVRVFCERVAVDGSTPPARQQLALGIDRRTPRSRVFRANRKIGDKRPDAIPENQIVFDRFSVVVLDSRCTQKIHHVVLLRRFVERGFMGAPIAHRIRVVQILLG